jgi:predicted flap endonuclease-1-like 5' DNA nuclease
MANIRDIEGIGDAQATKLEAAGVKTLAGLLQSAGSRQGRTKLSEATGLSEARLLEWVNRADLDRINGIGSEYADLLEAAGVDSVPELARRNAPNLTAKMIEINDAKKLVRQVPTESAVTRWIEEAKNLDRAVTH